MTKTAPHPSQVSESVIESSIDGIAAFDRDFRYIVWNPAMERLFGRTSDEVIGRSAFELFPHLCGTPVENALVKTIAGEPQVLLDQPSLRPGPTKHYEVRSSPLYDEHGEVIGGLALTRDITDRRQLEEELRRSQKMEASGRLAGGIAHDFNNLLTAIRGFTELFGERSDDEDARRYAGEITKAADQAAVLVHQLLSFGRRQMLQPQVLSLNALVIDMGEMLKRLLGENVRLEIETGADPSTVKADPGDLEQILLNLVVNARDALPDGGAVTIRTARRTVVDGVGPDDGLAPGEYVMLEVVDDGTGMDSEVASQAFEPFFTTKDVGKGSGLGLSTVYGIARRSGGTVELETARGRGTTITAYLPSVAEEATPSSARPDASPEQQPSQTIVLVEDADGVRSVVREILRGAGYAVLEAKNGMEALQICRSHGGPLDLLLSDVVMPGISGPEIAERVTGLRPETQVLYMSGYADDVLSEDDRTGGRLLHKPFSRRELLDAVASMLGMSVDEYKDNVVPLPSGAHEARLRVLIADDHPAVLSAMRSAFARANVEIVGEARDGADAIERIGATAPDVAVLDARMPAIGGVEATRRVGEIAPGTSVIVYSGYAERELLTQALDAGARGFVLKDAPLADLVRAVQLVAAGGTYADPRLAGLELSRDEPPRPTLTAREQDVLRLAAEGMTNNGISERLGISPETVQTHVRKAMSKLEAESRTQDVAKALRSSLIA